jgi:glycerol kinase
MNGLLGLDICSSLDELAKLPRAQTVFRPAMKAATVKKLHAGWEQAVKRVL